MADPESEHARRQRRIERFQQPPPATRTLSGESSLREEAEASRVSLVAHAHVTQRRSEQPPARRSSRSRSRRRDAAWRPGSATTSSSSAPAQPGSVQSEPGRVVWEFVKFEVPPGLDVSTLWLPFDSDNNDRLERAWQQYNESSNPQDGGSTIQVGRGRYTYDIDFDSMTQTNQATGTSRRLRRRQLPHRSGAGDSNAYQSFSTASNNTVASSSHTANDLIRGNASLCRQIHLDGKRIEVLQARVDDLMEEEVWYKAAVQSKDDLIEELRDAVRAKDDAVAALRYKVWERTAEVARTTEEVGVLLRKMQQSDAALRAQTAEAASLRRKTHEIEAALRAKTAEAASLQRKTQESEAALREKTAEAASLQRKTQESEAALRAKTAEAASLQRKAQESEAELRAKTAEAASLQRKTQESEAALRAKTAEADSIQRKTQESEAALRAKSVEAASLQRKAQESEAAARGLMQELELRTQASVEPATSRISTSTFPRALLKETVENLIPKLVPRDHFGECQAAASLDIVQIDSIHNPAAWKFYAERRRFIEDRIANRTDCPWVMQTVPALRLLAEAFAPFITIRGNANEVLLLHGTKPAHAHDIMEQGFDPCLSVNAMYGKGIYQSTDICKVVQYCKECDSLGRFCMILTRAVLGDPHIAQGPMRGALRPPMTTHGVPHDSIIAMPGTPINEQKKQVHHEFVISKGDQLYPELVIWFRFRRK